MKSSSPGLPKAVAIKFLNEIHIKWPDLGEEFVSKVIAEMLFQHCYIATEEECEIKIAQFAGEFIQQANKTFGGSIIPEFLTVALLGGICKDNTPGLSRIVASALFEDLSGPTYADNASRAHSLYVHIFGILNSIERKKNAK
ncbi:MAG: hypothetical protein HDS36_00845 [Bacteroides sp.]|nr:hypothetical protein [Bacteroides sp.]